MSDFDSKEVKEVLDPELPEAPLSINIGSHYKGFYVGWTKRSADTTIADKISEVKKFIDGLVEAGYVPSWNPETNKAALGSAVPPAKPVQAPTPAETTGNVDRCKICGGEVEYREGVKKTNPKEMWRGYFCLSNRDHTGWLPPKKI